MILASEDIAIRESNPELIYRVCIWRKVDRRLDRFTVYFASSVAAEEFAALQGTRGFTVEEIRSYRLENNRTNCCEREANTAGNPAYGNESEVSVSEKE